ncbi:MAG: ATP synthase F1 subunit delta [bacterium]
MINEYAKAFFELSNELKNLDIMTEAFEVFIQNYKNDFKKLLLSPKISKQEKKEVIKKCFKSCDINFINFINVVIDNSRVDMFEDIYNDFNLLIDEKNNVVTIDVYSTEVLSTEQTDEILNKLSNGYIGKSIVLDNHIDKELLGGIKLFHNGKQIDGSIKSQLNRLKENL